MPRARSSGVVRGARFVQRGLASGCVRRLRRRRRVLGRPRSAERPHVSGRAIDMPGMEWLQAPLRRGVLAVLRAAVSGRPGSRGTSLQGSGVGSTRACPPPARLGGDGRPQSAPSRGRGRGRQVAAVNAPPQSRAPAPAVGSSNRPAAPRAPQGIAGGASRAHGLICAPSNAAPRRSAPGSRAPGRRDGPAAQEVQSDARRADAHRRGGRLHRGLPAAAHSGHKECAAGGQADPQERVAPLQGPGGEAARADSPSDARGALAPAPPRPAAVVPPVGPP